MSQFDFLHDQFAEQCQADEGYALSDPAASAGLLEPTQSLPRRTYAVG